MISKKLSAAINAQINAELWSSYLYLSMSNWCQSANYEGMAHWFRLQAREEQDHADIFSRYLVQQGDKVLLQPINAVPNDWGSPVDLFIDALRHEEKVSKLIAQLMKMAVQEEDFSTQSRLLYFIDEQVEEEDSFRTIVAELQQIGACECGCGLRMLDDKLHQRAN